MTGKVNLEEFGLFQYIQYIFKSECEFLTKVSKVVPAGCRNFPASGVKFYFKQGYDVWLQNWCAYKYQKIAGVIDNP